MFYKIDDYLGVDTGVSPPTIMVPKDGFNLVVHDSGPKPVNPTGDVTAVDLSDALRKGIGDAASLLSSKVAKADMDRVIELVTLARAKFSDLGGTQRLLAVTANTPGDYSLSVDNTWLNVAVRARRPVSLSFRYYKYTGKDRPEWSGNHLDRTNAASTVDSLNNYFLPQANIRFVLQDAKDWETPEFFASANDNTAKQYDQWLADVSADYTACIFPYITSTDSAGESFHRPGSSVVWVRYRFSDLSDFMPGLNPFVTILAHELVHAMGKGGHSHRDGVVCTKIDPDDNQPHHNPRQGLLIDKVTLDFINPVRAH